MSISQMGHLGTLLCARLASPRPWTMANTVPATGRLFRAPGLHVALPGRHAHASCNRRRSSLPSENLPGVAGGVRGRTSLCETRNSRFSLFNAYGTRYLWPAKFVFMNFFLHFLEYRSRVSLWFAFIRRRSETSRSP